MRRPTQNFIIDLVAFAGFVLLVATGVLLYYILPPGSGHYTTLWGMDRHEWGDIHLWIAVVFLGALTLHLILHWKWMIHMVRGRRRERAHAGRASGLGHGRTPCFVSLAVAPLLSPVEQSQPLPGRGGPAATKVHRTEGIQGSMTLQEVEQATGVPVEDLVRELGLPPDVSADERLSQLRGTYSFTLEDVRHVVGEHEPEE